MAMLSAVERVCCEEVPRIKEKKEFEKVDCITLQEAYFLLQQHYGSSAPQGSIAM